jgi:acyl-CoA dehydrogenase
MGLIASETAALVFENCRVPRENLLGGEERYASRGGFKGAMKSFDLSRPVIGATAVGIGRAAYERTQEIAGDGKTVRPRLATMKRKLDAARLLVWRAAWLADHGMDNAAPASIAKAFSAQVALEVCSMAVETCGEAGLRGDSLVEKLYRDVKALDIVEGTGQIQRIVIARRLVGLPADDA